MTYVALLRGINVGGNNKVEMKKLKISFENLGFTGVRTFINSGNVIFQTDRLDHLNLVKLIEAEIVKEFGLNIKVVLRDLKNLEVLCEKVPSHWENNDQMKTEVMFLWEEVDYPEIINELKHNPEVENLIYISGALVWNIKRENYNQGQVPKFISTKLYSQITARNINTVRKLLKLMK